MLAYKGKVDSTDGVVWPDHIDYRMGRADNQKVTTCEFFQTTVCNLGMLDRSCMRERKIDSG